VIAKLALPEFNPKLSWHAVQFNSPGAFVTPHGGPLENALPTTLTGPITASTNAIATTAREPRARFLMAASSDRVRFRQPTLVSPRHASPKWAAGATHKRGLAATG
jgi:hypothetical protein